MTRQFPSRPIPAIGVVVWKGDHVQLIQRGKPPRAGSWSLPGGAQKLGETVFEAAIREVTEETGIQIETLGLIDVIDSIDRDNDSIEYHYTLIDIGARWLSGTPLAADDAIDARWVALDDIGAFDLWSETERIIRLSAHLHGPCRNIPYT
ncbi:MAG: NUDIX hydrolase [Rhodospirillales bacterium]|nr:NUDIX hydrolase [Rhodospirillales bacterium]